VTSSTCLHKSSPPILTIKREKSCPFLLKLSPRILHITQVSKEQRISAFK